MRDTPDDFDRDSNGMTEGDHLRLQELIHARTGIFLDESKRYFLRKRIERRMAATGQATFRSWFNAMRFEASQEEFQALVNEITVNETYFWREAHQFDILAGHVLPEIVARERKGPIRIWSMPCATGEEPYSIALHLGQNWPGLALHDVEIEGSDIDTRALAAARRGVFNARSVQNLPAPLLRRHFRQTGPQDFALDPAIRDVISFSKVNLIDMPARWRSGEVDVVFCRNMLIYFDQAAQRKAVENLHEALRPGGFVFLGHSESMSRISTLFTARRFAGGFAYQKPLEAS